MGNVISIRVPPEIKREMDELKGEVNWSEEIREFIKKKIKEHKKRKALQEVIAYIQALPTAPRGTARRLVREDRDNIGAEREIPARSFENCHGLRPPHLR